jgi:hypothetical protein
MTQFKVGDKVRRKKEHQKDDWWWSVCSSLRVDLNAIFTVCYVSRTAIELKEWLDGPYGGASIIADKFELVKNKKRKIV